jgi:hypothetical protein
MALKSHVLLLGLALDLCILPPPAAGLRIQIAHSKRSWGAVGLWGDRGY